MKFMIERSKQYLLLAYLSMSFVFFKFVVNQDSVGQLMLFVMLLVIAYDSVLNVIQQFTGDRSNHNSLTFFSALMDLNKRVQNFHEIDDVLLAVDDTLKGKVRVRRSVILLNAEFSSELLIAETEYDKSTCLVEWKGNEEKYSFLNADFEREILKLNGIKYASQTGDVLKKALKETKTSLLIPVIQEKKILCVILVSQPDEQARSSHFENQMLEFMANQLAIVLDRILMYEKLKHKTEMDHAEKMQVMQSLSTNIAHEMRTPLSGIRASISGVEAYLDDLMSAYDYAVAKGAEEVTQIREDHLGKIKGTPKRITLMIDQANAVIDMLLMNLRENSLNRKQLSRCSAAECVEQAVDRYPFKMGERGKVKMNIDEDFDFMGVESLFVYIIFNLMKNALYSLSSGQEGEIFISLKKGRGCNEVLFKDTGEGIEEAIITNIFDGFFTTKNDGTGVGLAYCKRTAENFGGDIECRSVLGDYAEFIISLPVVKDGHD